MDARRDPDPHGRDHSHPRSGDKSPEPRDQADAARWGFLLTVVLGTVAGFALLWVIWQFLL